jgi:putative transposase
MSMSRFAYGKHCVYNLGYHVIWIPKYRKVILKGTIKDIIEKSLFEKAKDLNIIIEKYEIMPDHIHLFIKCNPKQDLSNIIGQLKGYSSYRLRSEYPKYKKYKSL